MEIPLELLQEAEKTSPFSNQEQKEFLKKAANAKATELDTVSQIIKRRSMIAMTAPEDVDVAFERYMGDNDLLPLNYLELGFLKGHSVGRIRYQDTIALKPVVATGFLISPDLVMTNHHVFPDINSFKDPFIEFDYYYDLNGVEKEKTVFQLNPQKFFHADKSLDFCLIGVEKKDVKGMVDIKSRGYLVMNPITGKAGNGDYAGVIQHPEGQPMQVAIRENKILDVTSNPMFLYYNSDTSPGSSGAAVFNDQWQLIALHSAGTAKKNAAQQYVDADNNPIPVDPVTNKIDSSKIVWENNRGVRVSALWAYMHSNSTINTHPLILALNSPNYSDERSYLYLSLADISNENPSSAPGKSNEIPVVVPPAPTQMPGNIHVHIHIGSNGAISIPSTVAQNFQTPVEFEKKIEDEIDFSLCQGFDTFFMAEDTPLPTLSNSLRKKVAKLVDNPNAYVLKYHHFSTVQHAVRRMPVYSAINIYGKRRYTELQGRSDNWYRDRRIDFDVQLNDEFYYKSKMDKGHMARREDAEWGNTIAFAENAANMTCSYANACPQVPALNRNMFGYKGEWGQLEGLLLEAGVEKEGGAEARICVYNGPIFNEDDPVFKSVQIPMAFFKVVVWRNKNKEIKSTGFVLSQAELVGDVDFEKLVFDEIFTHRQVPIPKIEALTQLHFDKIRDWDTNS